MDYTKGETAGGWIHIQDGKKPIGLVHPKYVNKFLAVPDMYKALMAVSGTLLAMINSGLIKKEAFGAASRIKEIDEALAKGKE